MKAFALVVMVTLLMAGASVYAQTAMSGQYPNSTTPSTGKMAEGVIADIDARHQRVTLQDGEQFVLPPSFAETSPPEVGEQVEVTYEEVGGQKIVRSIDTGDTGHGETGG